MIEDFLETRGWSEDDYRDAMAKGKVSRGMPTQLDGGIFGICASEVPLNLDECQAELDEYKAKVEEKEAEASADEAGADVRAAKFTGVCIVVCKTQSDMYKVLQRQKRGICFWLAKLLCGSCCLDKDDYWMFARAPEPSDINWENMGLTAFDSCCRQFNSLIATLIMLGGSFTAIWFIK
jgi:hypothetical protein